VIVEAKIQTRCKNAGQRHCHDEFFAMNQVFTVLGKACAGSKR